ncbi:MAG: hypothetical protein AB7L90_14620 [Hyphomicrobiaceae bacterium]
MKALVLAAAAAATLAMGGLVSPGAEAAPAYKRGFHATHNTIQKVRVTPHERARIRHSKARLNRIEAKAYADGKVTTWERLRLNKAQQRHRSVVRRAVR